MPWVNPKSERKSIVPGIIKLNGKKQELFEILFTRADEDVSVAELKATLWGEFSSTSLLRVHMYQLRLQFSEEGSVYKIETTRGKNPSYRLCLDHPIPARAQALSAAN